MLMGLMILHLALAPVVSGALFGFVTAALLTVYNHRRGIPGFRWWQWVLGCGGFLIGWIMVVPCVILALWPPKQPTRTPIR